MLSVVRKFTAIIFVISFGERDGGSNPSPLTNLLIYFVFKKNICIFATEIIEV